MGTVTSLPPGESTPGSWYLFSRNLYADWTSEGLSIALSISNIELRSNGHDTSGTDHAQEIFRDDLALQTTLLTFLVYIPLFLFLHYDFSNIEL